jgi:signal transduction histidine kinase
MTTFLLLLSILVLAGLLLHIYKLRKVLAEFTGAMGRSRRVFQEQSVLKLKRLGLYELTNAYNAFADRYADYAEQNTGYSDQVDATLGAVQEVVIIFNQERIIEFANRSAEALFEQRNGLKGTRLESTLRSPGLLELLGNFSKDKVSKLAQVSLEHNNELLWFEASCAQVKGVAVPQGESTLLVLHDITKLKQLEEMRREFIANVSHELRTPLTIIKGFAETLIEDDASISNETRTRFLGKISTSAERLHILVEDLLSLSRLESKPDQIESQLNSMQSLFIETADNYRRRVDSLDQQIVLDIDERVGDFYFDRFRINQVLDNLVENVFRYASDFKQLTLQIRLESDLNEVCCAVIDDGPGIPAKDVPHIFERFYRVDKGRSRDRGGTGLGLSITKHIVQSHGGRIYAESDLGQGVAIYFCLPYRN